MAENKAKIQIYRTLVPSHGKSAVALGIFDGLHLGHQSVISLAVKGTAQGLVPTVLTFSENPKFCGGGQALLTEREKIRLLSGMGVQQLYLLDFNSIKDMTADEFVCNILRGTCRAEKACCGFNYTFGRGGKAGSADLKTALLRKLHLPFLRTGNQSALHASARLSVRDGWKRLRDCSGGRLVTRRLLFPADTWGTGLGLRRLTSRSLRNSYSRGSAFIFPSWNRRGSGSVV